MPFFRHDAPKLILWYFAQANIPDKRRFIGVLKHGKNFRVIVQPQQFFPSSDPLQIRGSVNDTAKIKKQSFYQFQPSFNAILPFYE
jgi:hypothetical protein